MKDLHHVKDLPEHLQVRLQGRDVIVFDAVCVLCTGFLRFMVRADRQQRFQIATSQGPLGQALYRALGLPTDEFETNLVIVDGRIHRRMGAFAAAMGAVGWPWRVLSLLRFVPQPLADFAYHRIARNRYAIFGRYDTCILPDASVQARFLDDLSVAEQQKIRSTAIM